MEVLCLQYHLLATSSGFVGGNSECILVVEKLSLQCPMVIRALAVMLALNNLKATRLAQKTSGFLLSILLCVVPPCLSNLTLKGGGNDIFHRFDFLGTSFPNSLAFVRVGCFWLSIGGTWVSLSLVIQFSVPLV